MALLLCGNSYAQTWPIRVEAENYDSASNVTVEEHAEGEKSIKPGNSSSWLMYRIFVPKDGWYRLRLRMSGQGGVCQIKDSLYNNINRIAFPSTGSKTVFTNGHGLVRLRYGLRKLRVYFQNDISNFDYLEIDTSKYWIYNNFTSTIDFSSATPWKNTIDSIGYEKETVRTAQIQLVEAPGRPGKTAVRFELAKTDKPFVRSEIRLPSVGPAGVEPAERWYGWSEYLPSAYWSSPDPHQAVIFQLHEIPDWDLGEDWRSPPIMKKVQNGNYYFNIMWDADSVNTNASKDGEITPNLGPIIMDQWVDWVVHVKFSSTNTGIFEVWRNGVKVYERLNLPNCFADRFYPYFKIGVYCNAWCCDEYQATSPGSHRVVYIRNIRVGYAGCTRHDVAP